MNEPSSYLRAAFAVIPVVVALAFIAGVYRAGMAAGRSPVRARRDALFATVLAGAWMALTLAGAASGRLSFASRPPTMVVLFAALVVIAVVVTFLVATGRASVRLVRAWNVLSMVLLVNIVTIALLSAPTPYRVFMNEPANVWVTRPPFVWLPAVLVLAALLGHLVLFRRLANEPRD
jgi:hypothetical protein